MQHKSAFREHVRLSVRRRDRIEARNRVMTARYYYWTEIRRLRFDDVLHILSSEEFFIEDRTICNILSRMDGCLSELRDRKAIASDLERAYPSWSWRITA
jgi:hypothetical protein